MLKAIRIENLRSLKDTGFIELKPLNILLGANSSGKSTFLRSFPLLTQSVRKELRGPISWFDDSLVDFGDYNTAYNRYAQKDDRIRFSFKLEYPFLRRRLPRFIDDQTTPSMLKKMGTVSFTMSLANDSKGTYIDKLIVKDDYNVCIVRIDSRNEPLVFTINGIKIATSYKWNWDFYTYTSFLPHIIPQKGMTSNEGERFEYVLRHITYDILRKYCSSSLKNTKAFDTLIEHWSPNPQEFLEHMKLQNYLRRLKKNVQPWMVDDANFKEIYSYVSLYFYNQLLKNIDNEISNFFIRTSYIAPMRAEGSRYYRSQGLQVKDIDPYGKNLEEFIASLTPVQRTDYNTYVSRILKVNINIRNTANYNSLVIGTGNESFNITDVGFGYSQIIPIITKLWFSDYKRRKGNRLIYSLRFPSANTDLVTAIEQPELHLHPAYQAKIADVFMSLLNSFTEEDDDQYKLLVETHSPTIINRIGRRIREGKFLAKNVNIILFQKDIENKNSQVSQTSYDSNGQIQNWPYGFFDPDDDEF